MKLAWVVVVGVIGIVVYAEMSGRVAAIVRPAGFRPRPRAARAACRLAEPDRVARASTFLTLTAELAGIALAIELITSVNYLLWIPVAAVLVWFVIWRVQVRHDGERVRSRRAWRCSCSPSQCGSSARTGVAAPRGRAPERPDRRRARRRTSTSAIALFGAAMTPYEVFFFSSGAVEEHWTEADLVAEPRQRLPRLPARRDALARDHGDGRARAAAARHRRRTPVAGRRCRSALELGKVGLALVIARLLRRDVRRRARDRACRRATPSSQFFGWQLGQVRDARVERAALPPRRARRRSSRGAAFALDRASTRSRSPSTRSCSPRPRCR